MKVLSNSSLSLPRNKILYLSVLAFITLASFGNNYSFNNPQALHEILKEKLAISQSEFQLFYTIFAFPNIFSAFFIGYMIDYFGLCKGFIVLVMGVCIFQSLVSFGAYLENYYIMIVGRLFFGIASQSLVTAQAALVSSLFSKYKVALALGVVITFPEIGNALNSFLTIRFYNIFGQQLGPAFLVSVVICISSAICAILAVFLVRKITKDQQNKNVKKSLRKSLISENSTNNEVLVENTEKIKLQDLKQLKLPFWILAILSSIFLGMYIAFLDGANGLLQERFQFDQQKAGQIIMVTYISAVLMSIPCGLFIDRWGKRVQIAMFGSIILLSVQIILIFTSREQIYHILFSFFCLGFGLALYANCLLSCVSILVQERIIGTAFGIIQMFESIALSLMPLISGLLVDHNQQKQRGYINSEIFFSCIGASGVIVSALFLWFTGPQKHRLNQGKRIIKTFDQRAIQVSNFKEINISEIKKASDLDLNLLQTMASLQGEKKDLRIEQLQKLYL